MTDRPEATPNLLLGILAAEDRHRLFAQMTRVQLPVKNLLVEINTPVSHVYFPESGIGSIVARSEEAETTEVGIIGREGMSAAFMVLGTDRSPHQSFIQVGEATALRIGADDFRAALAASPVLHAVLLRYVQTWIVQSAQSTACNAHYRLEARLARWILMCHDRIDGDDLFLTHEFMSMMIASQRSGVTVSLHILEGAGMIRSTRGLVTIVDRSKLIEIAGSSYGVPEAEYRRLIAPFGK